jgi:hypothetical protein
MAPVVAPASSLGTDKVGVSHIIDIDAHLHARYYQFDVVPVGVMDKCRRLKWPIISHRFTPCSNGRILYGIVTLFGFVGFATQVNQFAFIRALVPEVNT